MAWLAIASMLTGAALSRWCRIVVLAPLIFGIFLLRLGAAVAGLLTVATASFCAMIETVALQAGFLSGRMVQSRMRAKRRKLSTVRAH